MYAAVTLFPHLVRTSESVWVRDGGGSEHPEPYSCLVFCCCLAVRLLCWTARCDRFGIDVCSGMIVLWMDLILERLPWRISGVVDCGVDFAGLQG